VSQTRARIIGYAFLAIGFAAYGAFRIAPTVPTPTGSTGNTAVTPQGAQAPPAREPAAGKLLPAPTPQADFAADRNGRHIPPEVEETASLPPGLRTPDKLLTAGLDKSESGAYQMDKREFDLPLLRLTEGAAPIPETVRTFLRGPDGAGTPRVTIVNFWSDFCGPCKTEMPFLKTFVDSNYQDDTAVGYVALHVMMDKKGALGMADFVKLLPGVYRRDMPAKATFLFEPGDGASPLMTRLRSRMVADAEHLPLTVLIDCVGRIRWIHNGKITAEFLNTEMKPLITDLLAETGSAGVCPVPRDGTCTKPVEGCSPKLPECNFLCNQNNTCETFANEGCSEKWPMCNYLCKNNGNCDEFAGEECAPGVTDCYEECHKNNTCDEFAGESYAKPGFFEVCKSNLSPKCRPGEYVPVQHPWCALDDECEGDEERAAIAGLAKKTQCLGGCAAKCTAFKRMQAGVRKKERKTALPTGNCPRPPCLE
jgi:thiol-disulfide isomerase/thioredoxin